MNGLRERARPASAPEPPEPVAGRESLLRRMGGGAIALSALTLLASAVNYASNLVFSRMLAPASFGDLTALLALSVVLAVPAAAAQTRIAERVATYEADGERERSTYLIRHSAAHLGTIAAVITLAYLVSIPLVVSLLDLQAPGPAIALAPLIGATFLFPVLYGTLQGLGRFVAFGIVALAVAVGRLVFGVPWVAAGGGSGGAIAGQALAMVFCLAVGLWAIRHHSAPRGRGAATTGLKRRPDIGAMAAGGAFVAFAVISNLDLILAKLFMSAHDAGLYSALATVGKVLAFLPAAVAVIVVPNAARADASSGERTRVLRTAAMLVCASTAVVAIPAMLASRFVIRTMFGEEYMAATSGVLPIVVAGAGLSLLYLLVVFAVAIEDRRWTWLLIVGIAVQVTGIALFHDSPTQVAGVQAAVVGIVLLGNELIFHSLLPRPRAGGLAAGGR